ncbi:hypothetical protein C1G86_1565 [Dehalococcoides mccartyi]|uniref:Uncharacterized protein n=1 Tax=Dehalococcoides mccartyi TaxID=61435 RepID=A0A328EQZ1_9CHLR|nr:hypothetical protein C1G86_1565 [Dehalococcoides mccartyi]
MAIEGLLDELGKVGILASQVEHSSGGDDLAGVESGIDYE